MVRRETRQRIAERYPDAYAIVQSGEEQSPMLVPVDIILLSIADDSTIYTSRIIQIPPAHGRASSGTGRWNMAAGAQLGCLSKDLSIGCRLTDLSIAPSSSAGDYCSRNRLWSVALSSTLGLCGDQYAAGFRQRIADIDSIIPTLWHRSIYVAAS